jgi:hypothetical protein
MSRDLSEVGTGVNLFKAGEVRGVARRFNNTSDVLSIDELVHPQRLPGRHHRDPGVLHRRARDGSGAAASYRNTTATAAFLDATSPRYIGGFLEMSNARLYGFWGNLTEALRTGRPQNEIKHTGRPVFDELYADPARLEQFMNAMSGISAGNFHALAEKLDLSRYQTDSVSRHAPAPAPGLSAAMSVPWLRSSKGRGRSGNRSSHAPIVLGDGVHGPARLPAQRAAPLRPCITLGGLPPRGLPRPVH